MLTKNIYYIIVIVHAIRSEWYMHTYNQFIVIFFLKMEVFVHLNRNTFRVVEYEDKINIK